MTRNMRNNDAATAKKNSVADAPMGTTNAGMNAANARMNVATMTIAPMPRSKGLGRSMSTAAALLLAAAVAMPAAAGGRDRADADIESLDAVLRISPSGAELVVRYDIEIEDAWYGERFDLLLEIEQRDGLVRDASGRPVLLAVPLGSPSEVDDDELEFESTVSLSVPAPRDLSKLRNTRIIATVVRAGSDLPLDSERESLRVELLNAGGPRGEWRELPEFGEVREVSTATCERRTTAVRRTTTTTRRTTTVTRPGTVRIGIGVNTGTTAPRPGSVRRPLQPRRGTTTIGRTTSTTHGRDNGREVRRNGETRRTNDGRHVRRTSNGRDTHRVSDNRRSTDSRRVGDSRRAGNSRETRRETSSTRRNTRSTSTQHTRTVRR